MFRPTRITMICFILALVIIFSLMGEVLPFLSHPMKRIPKYFEVQRYSTTKDEDKKLDTEQDLTQILKPFNSPDPGNGKMNPEDKLSDLSTTPYIEEHYLEGDLGDVPIPTTGISVAEEMEKTQKDRFYSEVVRISGLGDGVKAAQIVSSSTGGGYDVVRYLIRLSRKTEEDDIDEDTAGSFEDNSGTLIQNATSDNAMQENFVLVDVPPYSEKLVQQMQQMMGSNGRLSAILVTSRDGIHYDDAPAVFTIRRADLLKWGKAFPETAIVAYRMDIPRDCRESVTQRLDGYGPWALQDDYENVSRNVTFIETGRPMTVNEWHSDMAMDIIQGRRKPPSEEGNSDTGGIVNLTADGQYTPEAIRRKEEGKRILAIYTPGRTYGSVSYVFPELGLCASGFTLPLEDAREESWGVHSTAGPALDFRGYITTSKAGIGRQMESARKLAHDYIDRFKIVLPSRGDPFYLQENVEDRRQTILEIIDQYEMLGRVYEELGITGTNK